MLRWFPTILLLSLLSAPASGQTYRDLVARADSLYDAESFAAAAGAYAEAAAREPGRTGALYNAACSWSLAGEPGKAFDLLRQAAQAGFPDTDLLQRDTDLAPLRETPEWTEILALVQANRDDAEKNLNRPLKERLERIYVRDQTLRHLVEPARETFGPDSKEMDFFWSLMSREDSLCLIEVEEILDEVGWPGRSLVGGQANKAAWLVIQHAPLETQERHLPALRQSVLAGESAAQDLALLEDRIRMRNGKPQIYGSQVENDPDTGGRRLALLEDPHHVNERRAGVGLGPIEDYLQNWDLEWDPDAMAARLAAAGTGDD